MPWEPQASAGPFSAVHVSPHLALDFDEFEPGAELPVLHDGVAYRSTPTGPDDFRINTWFGGHAWEALTVSSAHRNEITSVS